MIKHSEELWACKKEHLQKPHQFDLVKRNLSIDLTEKKERYLMSQKFEGSLKLTKEFVVRGKGKIQI